MRRIEADVKKNLGSRGLRKISSLFSTAATN